jgi:hypothetical protein
MRGEGALRQSRLIDELAGRKTFRLGADQQAKRRQPRRVGEGGQRSQCFIILHPSGFTDGMIAGQRSSASHRSIIMMTLKRAGTIAGQRQAEVPRYVAVAGASSS